MQYALPQLERLSIDVGALAHRRHALTEVLSRAGYAVLPPEGKFYLWVKWHSADLEWQWHKLADQGVFVLPGSLVNTPRSLPHQLDRFRRDGRAALPVFASQ
jgi:aspartate aminotransferase